jgi:large conductance mechanosensitive channel
VLKEFKEFAAKGNMLDMAVGIVIGAAFATIIGSLVNDIIMPPIGLALGGVDFAEMFLVLGQGDPAGPYATLAAAKESGAVTMNWGIFVNSLMTFAIIAFALFMVIKSFNKMKSEEEAAPEAPEAPPEPSAEETLLAEIRDLLRARPV